MGISTLAIALSVHCQSADMMMMLFLPMQFMRIELLLLHEMASKCRIYRVRIWIHHNTWRTQWVIMKWETECEMCRASVRCGVVQTPHSVAHTHHTRHHHQQQQQKSQMLISNAHRPLNEHFAATMNRGALMDNNNSNLCITKQSHRMCSSSTKTFEL